MKEKTRRLRHASVFSGIGGPEIAATMLGWENVFHCEINPFGRRVLEYWFPESESYEDITKTDFRRYRGQVDVLSGGFPCQPFSMAGKRKGAGDDRYLWPEMLRVIDEVRPSWVVGENVAGITSMVEPGEIADLGCEGALFGEGDGVHRYCSRGASPSNGSAQILRVQDIPSSRCLFRLVPLELLTEGTESSLLPTPRATEIVEHPMAQARRLGDRTGMRLNNLSSGAAFGLLPTPTACDCKGGGESVTSRQKTRPSGITFSANLRDLGVSGMLPTPTARDYQPSVSETGMLRKNGKMRNDALCNIPVMIGEHHLQTGGTTSQLSPLFVEEMMGFPLMWTTLPFLTPDGGWKASRHTETR